MSTQGDALSHALSHAIGHLSGRVDLLPSQRVHILLKGNGYELGGKAAMMV